MIICMGFLVPIREETWHPRTSKSQDFRKHQLERRPLVFAHEDEVRSIRKFGRFYLSWALPSTARSRQLILCTSACSSENTFSSSRVGLCNFTNPPWLCILGPPAVTVSIKQICYGPICYSFGRRELITLGYSVNRYLLFRNGIFLHDLLSAMKSRSSYDNVPIAFMYPNKEVKPADMHLIMNFF
jgi:hypothetical protein